MPRIDSIRSAARKQAWYHNNDPESRTYNFFARPSPQSRKRSTRDIENGLNHTQTENDARSPIEDTRRAGYGKEPVGGIRKSGTFPAGPINDRPRSRQEVEDIEEKTSSQDTEETKVATPAPAAFEESSVGTKTRKRRFHLPKFGGHKKDKELERTTTNKSSKSKSNRKFTVMGQLRVILFSWINILLVFVPVGLAFQYADLNGPATFVINFLAIVPLASMLSFATEELAHYVGDTFGGLLNASFGNATELIVAIIALAQGQVVIVQTSLLGSILSNLLLVLGMCFFFGGLNRLEQFFNITVAQTAASLLALAIGALITPTAFRMFSDNDTGVTPLSRAAAVLLLLTYICYIVFQLRTHIDMYNEPSQKSEKQNLLKSNKKSDPDLHKDAAVAGASGAAMTGGSINKENLVQERKSEEHSDQQSEDDGDGADEPQLSKLWALATLVAATALIAVTSDGMVSAIDSVTEPDGPLSEEFVGLILVPIVGNAAEHATAVTVAIKDKMDLAIGVAVGSSLQIALLVIPVMVILSWIGVGSTVLTLNFDGFQVVVLFLAVILVNYVIQDGRSHWLEGVMLFVTYLVFAVAAWYYPAPTSVPS